MHDPSPIRCTSRAAVVRAVAAGAVFSLLLSSCMVGPNFRSPAAPAVQGYTEAPLPPLTAEVSGIPGGVAQRFVPGGDIAAQWWSLFRSEPLDRLVRRALDESPTLAAAEAALRQSRENLLAARGALLVPNVDASVSAAREKSALAGPSAGVFNLYNASVNVSYALDVFGGNRRQIESLQSAVDYQGFQLRAAHLALTSNIVTAAVREASVRAQIAATNDIIRAQEKQLDLVNRQFRLGAVARLNVLSLSSQVAQTRATLPGLERQLAETRHQLAALSGRSPADAELPVLELDALTLPQDLPVSLPSALVRQRPDIRAAEALLHQASAQVGVATANLYPNITLSASAGPQVLELHRLFDSTSLVWSLGAGLLQPLFHGGELQARQRAAVAAYDTAAAQYRGTVLQGFQNVADALTALETDARALSAQADAEAQARQNLQLTTRQFELGGASSLPLFVAQQQYQQARLSLAQAQAARYADTAALFQALGGGWADAAGNERALVGSSR